jgi:hypothetical protein
MILSRRVALNGAELDEIHEAIVIRAVDVQAGKDNISAVSGAAGNGQRVTARRRDTLDVIVKFALDIRRDDLQARSEALEAVNAWAAAALDGAWLTVSWKPGRRLRVRLAQAPGEGDLWKWTEDFQITLRAYEVPFWEDEDETADTGLPGLTASQKIVQIPGSAPPAVAAELKNTSGMTLNTAAVSIGENTMRFDDLQLQADETLVIDHTDSGLLRIRIRSGSGLFRSVMANRLPESADDFQPGPGAVRAGFSAQRACQLTVRWRCRYL